MAKDFLPTSDLHLLNWSANFDQGINADPTSIGLTTTQASAYTAAHQLFSTRLATATDPATRTRGTVNAKNDARRALKALARELARIINAHPGVTNQQRIDLGLNPRKGEIHPIHAPTEPPLMEVIRAYARTLSVRVHALASDRRGKPEGVAGCSVFSYVGTAPPADLSEWTFQGNSTRTTFDIEFPPSTPAGAQVFLCACWYSPRAQPGPVCQPVSAYLAGGVTGSPQQQAA